MISSLRKRLYLFSIIVFLLVTVVPVYPHNMPTGGSKWCLRKNGIIVNIDLNRDLLSEIKGIKEGHYDLPSISDKQLQQISADILQPYIDKKLSITVNGKKYPVKVDKLVRNEAYRYTIWLSVGKISFDKPENPIKIDYRLLFEETGDAHLNLAFLYKSDLTGDALQRFFDFSQPEAQFVFENDSPVWEISFKGPVTQADVPQSIAAGLPVAKAGTAKDLGKREALVLQTSDKRTVIPETGNAVVKTLDRQNALPVTSAVQTKQEQDKRGVIPPIVSTTSQAPDVKAKGNIRSVWSNIGTFILLGIKHILTGYDHIAFLIGLIVIGLSIREVLKIITAFTIAHSITLLLAALQVIHLNSRFVESVIALSICYIALENLFRKEVKYRWLITFCFGLVHGFGFASALQELIVGKTNLLVSVVSFNLGVEAGQLMIFFVLLPVLYVLKQKMEFRKVTAGVSLAIFVLGFTWLIERLFDLKLIS